MVGAGNCTLEKVNFVFLRFFRNLRQLKPNDLIQELDREQRRHEELCRALS